MCTEAESWLEATYPELVEDWRDAYLNLPDRSDASIKECRICSIRQNTGLHYGVHTCEADKQFLKRTFHERQAYKICDLFCPPRLRGWCQYCRLRFSLRTGINLKMIRISEKKRKSARPQKPRVRKKSASPIKPGDASGGEMYNPYRPYLDTEPDSGGNLSTSAQSASLDTYYNQLALYHQQLAYNNYWNQIHYQMQGLNFHSPPAVQISNCEILSDQSTSPGQVLPLDLSWSSSSSSSQTPSRSPSQPPSRPPSQPPSRPSSAGSYTSKSSPRDSRVSEMGNSFNKLSVNSAVLQEALYMVHSTLSPGRFQDLSGVSDVLSE